MLQNLRTEGRKEAIGEEEGGGNSIDRAKVVAPPQPSIAGFLEI